ncbi:MAG TPA: TIGR03943 family protein [Herpetosiphonaceae bacterium]
MTTLRAQPTTTNWAALIEGCILAGLGAMLLRKTWDGQLPLYIHPRYTTLLLATSILVLLIGAFRLWQTGEGAQPLRGRLSVYGLLLAPLLLGVLIPAKPAGSALVDPRQMNNVGRGYTKPSALANDDSTKWTLYDWLFARYTLKPDEARGKAVDVVGFVYRDPNGQQTAADEFYVVRYTLACCVADRTNVSLPVKWSDATTLPNDQWVRVTGKIDLRPGEGPPEFVVTEARVEAVPQPSEPYLYP